MKRVLEKPPLKWAGGKRWLVPFLEPLWQPYSNKRLVEPFCGGLAVTLGLMPEKALLNDINPCLINFFAWLRRGLYINITMENDEELYYRHRSRFNQLLEESKENSRETAELFYYLNRTGYNGLCRFNRKGKFNVPFGKYRNINYRHNFYPYRSILAGWKFICGDFEKMAIKKDDFIYADPPYDVEFQQYTGGGFPWGDQVRLAQWLAAHPGPVATSNQGTDRIINLYLELGFNIKFIDGPRKISCTGNRTPAKEILAFKEPSGG